MNTETNETTIKDLGEVWWVLSDEKLPSASIAVPDSHAGTLQKIYQEKVESTTTKHSAFSLVKLTGLSAEDVIDLTENLESCIAYKFVGMSHTKEKKSAPSLDNWDITALDSPTSQQVEESIASESWVHV